MSVSSKERREESGKKEKVGGYVHTQK